MGNKRVRDCFVGKKYDLRKAKLNEWNILDKGKKVEKLEVTRFEKSSGGSGVENSGKGGIETT